MHSTDPTSLESSERLHSLFCVYILGQRPVKLVVLSNSSNSIYSMLRIYNYLYCDFFTLEFVYFEICHHFPIYKTMKVALPIKM
jgi:hypothetical protein